MKPSDDHAPTDLEQRALTLLLLVVSLAFGWILLPFYGTILWGAIIALLFAPLYRWLLPRLNRRRTLAALLTLLAALVIVVIPFALVSAALVHEAALVYERVDSGEWDPNRYLRQAFTALPEWVTALLDRFGLARFDVVQRRLAAAFTQASQFMAKQAFNIGQNAFEFIASIFIALYLAFFLIRDGDDVVSALRHSIPLAPVQKRELFAKFGTVIRATVKGSLVVAAIQGLLGGIAFWVLGVKWAVLCGVLMAFLSLLPAVGAALMWLPVAIYFFVTGAIWQSIALAAYGVLVIGLVDNVLRPMLVGKDTRLPDYLVMITTLGGIAVFGINGLVLGPVIAAMFIAVWHIYVTTRPATH
jgi:predicted PurR-regulated permease PerM